MFVVYPWSSLVPNQLAFIKNWVRIRSAYLVQCCTQQTAAIEEHEEPSPVRIVCKATFWSFEPDVENATIQSSYGNAIVDADHNSQRHCILRDNCIRHCTSTTSTYNSFDLDIAVAIFFDRLAEHWYLYMSSLAWKWIFSNTKHLFLIHEREIIWNILQTPLLDAKES